MGKNVVLVFCLFLASCAKVETATSENTQTDSDKTASVQPLAERGILLKPVAPNVKFNARQQKYLDEALPPKVREILEKAEKFEVLAEVRNDKESDGEGMTFEPNRVVGLIAELDKKNVLEAFYFDASRADSPAACYEPHHGIRATYQGKTVEVEICFSCSRFTVKSEFGEFDGTIVRENNKSENVFNQIIKSKSAAIKQ